VSSIKTNNSSLKILTIIPFSIIIPIWQKRLTGY